jgi:hypothetical protein
MIVPDMDVIRFSTSPLLPLFLPGPHYHSEEDCLGKIIFVVSHISLLGQYGRVGN